jgi:tetratricopeptide (TPR) repeat protein
MAVAVIIFLCCIFTFIAFRGNRLQRQQGTDVPAVEEMPAIVTPEVLEGLALAVDRVDQNPDDPYAHVQLAAAYLDAEMPELAQESMTQALVAGGQDEQFLWYACQQMETRQAWLLAARACVAAVELREQDGLDLPLDQLSLFHEVLYRAAKNPNLIAFFTMERLSPIDEPMAYVVKARYLLYNGDSVEAQATLDALLQIKPDMPEAFLLQAEFAARAGNRAEAQRWIDELQASPGVQDWMRQEAEAILNPQP